ncbi:MAG: hypothetical protein GY830_02375 [Bacteroidetes bacterium]|nr:hypothetical protein [Bacteroidota bacterium]
MGKVYNNIRFWILFILVISNCTKDPYLENENKKSNFKRQNSSNVVNSNKNMILNNSDFNRTQFPLQTTNQENQEKLIFDNSNKKKQKSQNTQTEDAFWINGKKVSKNEFDNTFNNNKFSSSVNSFFNDNDNDNDNDNNNKQKQEIDLNKNENYKLKINEETDCCECAICYDNIKKNECTSICNNMDGESSLHIYHYKCIKDWAENDTQNFTQNIRNASCPTCRNKGWINIKTIEEQNIQKIIKQKLDKIKEEKLKNQNNKSNINKNSDNNNSTNRIKNDINEKSNNSNSDNHSNSQDNILQHECTGCKKQIEGNAYIPCETQSHFYHIDQNCYNVICPCIQEIINPIQNNIEDNSQDPINDQFDNQNNNSSQQQNENNSSDHEKCTICLEELHFDNHLSTKGKAITPCFHKFHLECITNSISVKTSCPICRTDVTLGQISEFS